MKLFARYTAVLFFVFSCTTQLYAWVYPEHRRITMLAIQNLDPGYRLLFEKIWFEIRKENATRLSLNMVDTLQGRNPHSLDFASWPAIAGDHSCSPADMLKTILGTEWILQVADITAVLEINLRNAKTEAQHVNALRASDLQLLKADNEYVSRAGANTVHFLAPRKKVSEEANEYFTNCLQPDAKLNALGIYILFHNRALRQASIASQTQGQSRAKLLLVALADEAFALHFLEDAFAAGHIVGARGTSAVQKGTHDYYNKAGLEIQTWDGKRMVIKGDSYLDDKEAAFVATTVRKSLEAFMDVFSGKNRIDIPLDETKTVIESFSVCSALNLDPNQGEQQINSSLRIILMQTPMAGYEGALGELPRFRSELGSFIGVSASLNTTSISGGFAPGQTQRGFQGALEGAARFGLGLDGVLNQSGDGLVFIQAGWKQESSSTNSFGNSQSGTSQPMNSVNSAIQARSAYSLRIRLPFYLIPGDLIFASPLALFAPRTYKKMAITAVNGGLIPWQSGIHTNIGRFQMVFGREIGITFYGLNNPKDFLFAPINNNTSVTVVEYKSTRIDMPILEYRRFRDFSESQSSTLMVQLNAGVDIPHHAKTIIPGDPSPELKSIFYIGLRMIFNWRHYIGK